MESAIYDSLPCLPEDVKGDKGQVLVAWVKVAAETQKKITMKTIFLNSICFFLYKLKDYISILMPKQCE